MSGLQDGQQTLLLAAHADDETLFAAYLVQRYAAHIVVVYDEGRKGELEMAAQWLGCSCTQLGARKGMGEEEIETYLWGLHDPAGESQWGRIIYPLEEVAGHEEHNIVARLAGRVFAGPDVTMLPYRTYAPRGVRSKGMESLPASPEHVARKLGALSCYRSQIADPDSGQWFYSLLDMREWVE